jgi:transposase InsO family protein
MEGSWGGACRVLCDRAMVLRCIGGGRRRARWSVFLGVGQRRCSGVGYGSHSPPRESTGVDRARVSTRVAGIGGGRTETVACAHRPRASRSRRIQSSWLSASGRTSRFSRARESRLEREFSSTRTCIPSGMGSRPPEPWPRGAIFPPVTMRCMPYSRPQSTDGSPP